MDNEGFAQDGEVHPNQPDSNGPQVIHVEPQESGSHGEEEEEEEKRKEEETEDAGALNETKLDLSNSLPAKDLEFSIPDKEVQPPALAPYPGMGKEDLLRFSQSPFWVRMRLACLAAFWLGWLAILGAVIGLTIVAPRCSDPDEQDWWQHGTVYQIYVRSFYDTNNDGVGDLPGIEAKLDYIESLNVDGIVLSSFYETGPNGTDFGYDVINYEAIEPIYGTMEDFERFLEAAHDRDIKVLLEFIPNHTGIDHPWFVESSSSADQSNNPKWNYYVWEDCTSGLPTNWLNIVGDEAWTQNTSGRDQCYLHQFLPTQPDLNLRSSGVRQELEEILRFWLDKGVDGFRVNVPDFLYEDADLKDEADIPDCTSPSAYVCQEHQHTRSQPEVLGMIGAWRDILDSYTDSTGQIRILITDARNTLNDSLTYYGRGGDTGAHLPLNHELQTLRDTCEGICVRDLVDQWLYGMPAGATATWVTSSQDSSRILSSMGEEYTGAMALLTMTLPGVPFVYYGEEIGMINGADGSEDPIGGIIPEWSRDPFRSPMQWSDEENAGFSNSSTTWLPVNPNYEDVNVQVQEDDPSSPLALFRKLTRLRRDEGSLKFGNLHYTLADNNVFSFLREYDGYDRILTAINFGSAEVTVNLYEDHYLVPKKADVVMVTHPDVEGVEEGEEANLEALTLGPAQGAVFGWEYTR